jgi:hypothetical protein
MRILTKSKSAGDVNSALKKVLEEINQELKKIDGTITKLECDVSVGPSGASVTITTVLNGSRPLRKEVIGVNERGISKGLSIQKSSEKMNLLLAGKKGEIADMFSKTVVSLPGRAYTTMIAAINEEIVEEVKDANTRRERIKKSLELLNSDPSAINIAKVAEIFGVSRNIIYRDLEVLGFRRKEGDNPNYRDSGHG